MLMRYFFRKRWYKFSRSFFKPIVRINVFLNFKFKSLKYKQYTRYRFFAKIKKSLFLFKIFRNFKKDMFYYIYRTRTQSKIQYSSLTMTNFFKKKFLKKFKKRKFLRIWFLRNKYRILFARNRKVFNYFIALNELKKHRYTKYISQFKTKTPLELFTMFNYNVVSLLYYANFFYSFYQICHFIKQNFIYKNGRVVESYYTYFNVGDRLNLIFSKKYYFYASFMYFFFRRQLRKLGRFH